ncbi:hypothetical protein [Blastococcus saxobsidens]|uniref:PepSY domain-containing protein n=1 Tax=Blastococcus saxobsidens (strain DD2) TaxID=1146883 RepID=H6RRB7_BLASD|nr:hypothetical protein [Blastococcus saxobsidens]CCG04197.1 exported protein of unknown function [Blastococcus saxobsidens DD2]
MNSKVKGATLGAAALAAVVIGGTQIAQAENDAPPQADAVVGEDGTEVPEDDAGEEDEQVTGPDRDEAGAAALEAAGAGTVTEVEVADEGDTGYEVEVRLDDGSFVEVALDESFTVVSVEDDDD